jgi:hypothetical protein
MYTLALTNYQSQDLTYKRNNNKEKNSPTGIIMLITTHQTHHNITHHHFLNIDHMSPDKIFPAYPFVDSIFLVIGQVFQNL